MTVGGVRQDRAVTETPTPHHVEHLDHDPARRWAEALATWAVPDRILRQAPAAPWAHPPERFRVDPAALRAATAADTPSQRAARDALAGGGTVLDVGCGGGGSSLPLAGRGLTAVVGVDEQAAMLAQFAEAAEALGVPHTEVQGRWPDVAHLVPVVDVVVCHHVAYNVAPIVPFLRALTGRARRRVVVELPDHHPMTPLTPLWRHFWDLDRPTEPSSSLFVEVVRSLGVEAHVTRWDRPPSPRSGGGAAGGPPDPAHVASVRQRLCLTADRDPEVAAVLAAGPPAATLGLTTVWWEGGAR